jgi:hypothetical protein
MADGSFNFTFITALLRLFHGNTSAVLIDLDLRPHALFK